MNQIKSNRIKSNQINTLLDDSLISEVVGGSVLSKIKENAKIIVPLVSVAAAAVIGLVVIGGLSLYKRTHIPSEMSLCFQCNEYSINYSVMRDTNGYNKVMEKTGVWENKLEQVYQEFRSSVDNWSKVPALDSIWNVFGVRKATAQDFINEFQLPEGCSVKVN